MKTSERVLSSLEALGADGWRARIVPAEHIRDLEASLQGNHDQGLFDETFYQERLTVFSFAPPESLPEARSLIVVAIPVPQTQVVFHWRGEPRPAILPPTYVAYGRTRERAQARLAALLGGEGYRVAGTQLPLKLLAVSAGLAEYGRNNICYVPGMGSFLQLAACVSDLPAEDDPWREPVMMERCQSCTACQRLCPTGAIGQDRFLLHAERCLTFHNERGGPFPGWISPTWHNALLGCRECQRCCPEDKGVWEWVAEGGSFSEEETALILGGASRDQLPPAIIERLRELDLLEDLGTLARNLSVLLEAQVLPG